MNTPRYGMTITKIDHSALLQPDRSRLRKMSPKTEMRSQIQMKNKKKYSIERKTSPVPNCAATIGVSFVRGGRVPPGVKCPPGHDQPHHSSRVNSRLSWGRTTPARSPFPGGAPRRPRGDDGEERTSPREVSAWQQKRT